MQVYASVRVLHVYRTYFPATQGGLEEVIRQTCSNTQPHGVESKVFTLAQDVEALPIQRDEAEVHVVKRHIELSSCSISFSCLPKFMELVEWADIVQYHFPWPFADVLHFLGKVKKPTVLTYHSDIVRQRTLYALYRPLMMRFLNSIDRIVCTSPNYFATSQVLSAFQNKVEVIPIGLDSSHYQAHDDGKPDNLYSRNPPYFLFIGVLRYYKGLHILLEAMKDAPYKVVIVGSGPTETALKKQASKLQLNNVEFAGRVNDATKIHLLKNARAIVFPSYLRSEAFGVTLLEGAMFKKALISTEVGSGTSHVNLHRKTGLVIAPGSAKSLRNAMDELYKDSELSRRMGIAAYSRYKKLFTGSIMGQRYYNLYTSILQDTTPDSADLMHARSR